MGQGSLQGQEPACRPKGHVCGGQTRADGQQVPSGDGSGKDSGLSRIPGRWGTLGDSPYVHPPPPGPLPAGPAWLGGWPRAASQPSVWSREAARCLQESRQVGLQGSGCLQGVPSHCLPPGGAVPGRFSGCFWLSEWGRGLVWQLVPCRRRSRNVLSFHGYWAGEGLGDGVPWGQCQLGR